MTAGPGAGHAFRTPGRPGVPRPRPARGRRPRGVAAPTRRARTARPARGRGRRAGLARDATGRCAAPGRSASGWPEASRCSPGSGCSTCSSRSPAGSTAAVPGGFGTGKTVLLQQIAKWCDADVIVYVGCGERGNEMADVLAELAELSDPRTGGRLAERTVIIANTSNMPMMAREASIYTGITVAEYFRDMGHHAVVIADSTSRWAEALREFASRTGALPAEEGYPAAWPPRWPPSTSGPAGSPRWAATSASVTIIGAVSPPGGDLTEPVTAAHPAVRPCGVVARPRPRLRPALPGGVLGGLVLPGRRRSWVAGTPRHGDPEWGGRRARVTGLLAEADRLGDLADLVGTGSLPGHERVVLLAGRLLREGVLQQNALSAERRPLLRGEERRAGRRRARRRRRGRGRRGPWRARLRGRGARLLAVAARGRGLPPDDADEVVAPAGAGAGAGAEAAMTSPSAPEGRAPAPALSIDYTDVARAPRAAAGRPRGVRGRLGRVRCHPDHGGGGRGRRLAVERPPRAGPRGRPRPRRRAGARGHRRDGPAAHAGRASPVRRCRSRSAAPGWAGCATAAGSRSTAGRRSRRHVRAGLRRPAQPHRSATGPATRSSPGISAIDALTTLVRGQKLPIFSVAGPAPPRAGHPDRRAVDRGRRAVQRRLRGDGPDPRRRGRRA